MKSLRSGFTAFGAMLALLVVVALSIPTGKPDATGHAPTAFQIVSTQLITIVSQGAIYAGIIIAVLFALVVIFKIMSASSAHSVSQANETARALIAAQRAAQSQSQSQPVQTIYIEDKKKVQELQSEIKVQRGLLAAQQAAQFAHAQIEAPRTAPVDVLQRTISAGGVLHITEEGQFFIALQGKKIALTTPQAKRWCECNGKVNPVLSKYLGLKEIN